MNSKIAFILSEEDLLHDILAHASLAAMDILGEYGIRVTDEERSEIVALLRRIISDKAAA